MYACETPGAWDSVVPPRTAAGTTGKQGLCLLAQDNSREIVRDDGLHTHPHVFPMYHRVDARAHSQMGIICLPAGMRAVLSPPKALLSHRRS